MTGRRVYITGGVDGNPKPLEGQELAVSNHYVMCETCWYCERALFEDEAQRAGRRHKKQTGHDTLSGKLGRILNGKRRWRLYKTKEQTSKKGKSREVLQ